MGRVLLASLPLVPVVPTVSPHDGTGSAAEAAGSEPLLASPASSLPFDQLRAFNRAALAPPCTRNNRDLELNKNKCGERCARGGVA